MLSSGTTTVRSSSFARPASTSSISRPPRRSGRSPPAAAGSPRGRSFGRLPGLSPWHVRNEPVQSLDAQRKMRAALGSGHRVHLVEDQRSHRAEDLPRARGQQQEQRFGSRDQDVRRLAQHRGALLLRRVAGADRHAQLRAEPGERPAQVPLDVVVERLQRRDVQQAQTLPRLRVEPVDPVEEGRKRLARARRRLDQRVLPARNRRPAERLGRRRLGEGGCEPGARPGGEHRERIGHDLDVTNGDLERGPSRPPARRPEAERSRRRPDRRTRRGTRTRRRRRRLLPGAPQSPAASVLQVSLLPTCAPRRCRHEARGRGAARSGCRWSTGAARTAVQDARQRPSSRFRAARRSRARVPTPASAWGTALARVSIGSDAGDPRRALRARSRRAADAAGPGVGDLPVRR